mgnify:CR=1 FL=1
MSVGAFATTEEHNRIYSKTSEMSTYGAQGANQGDIYGSGELSIDLRAKNTSARVCVQVVARPVEDFDKTYYVAWTTPSGVVRTLYAKGNGEKYYFSTGKMTVEKGVHKFYFIRSDGDTSVFYGSARIENA